MLYRVKLVGKGASIRRGRVVVGGEGVLGVSVLIPSLLLLAWWRWNVFFFFQYYSFKMIFETGSIG
jgi:hypothetical protein